MSVCRLRRSTGFDPVQLGDELKQRNPQCHAEEDVVMWWGHENFSKSHVEDERRNFPRDRNWKKKLNLAHCVDKRSSTSEMQGGLEKSSTSPVMT